MKKIVEDLLAQDVITRDRFTSLKNVLIKKNIDYHIHQDRFAKNIVFDIGEISDDDEFVVIGAHYDVYGNSLGINDNYCAVATLIKFIEKAKTCGVKEKIKVVFFDLEESGMRGSRIFVDEYAERIKSALIFDIIGYGDNLVRCNSKYNNDIDFNNYGLINLSINLPSDNYSFENREIKNNLIVSLPKKDVVYYGGEYRLSTQHKFASSMHNGENDNNIDLITWNTVDKAYELLVELYIEKEGINV